MTAADQIVIANSVTITGSVTLTISLGPPTNTPYSTNIWAQRFGSTGTDICRAIAVWTNGDIVMGGGFQFTVDFGTGPLTAASSSPDMYIAGYSSSGTNLWSKRYGGTGVEVVRGIAFDPSGNIFVCGHFTGNVDFGGGTVTNAGINDIFIVKYNSVGVYQWQKIVGGTADDVATALCVDTNGAVYVTGYFMGTVNFGGGNLFSQFGGQDSYLAKYDSAGAYVFAKKFTNNADDQGAALACDSTNGIYLGGKFQGSIDLGGGNLVSAGATDMYLGKFNSGGTYIWGQRFGGTLADSVSGIAVDSSRSIYLLGSFTQSIDMGGGTITTGSSDSDAVHAKYNSAGTYQWASSMPGPGSEFPNAIACDSSGNSTVTGSFQFTINCGGATLQSASVGITDVFTAKYNSSGTHIWSYRGGGVNSDDGLAVGIDSNGYVAVGGSFSGTAAFGPDIFTSAGGTDVFLWRIAP